MSIHIHALPRRRNRRLRKGASAVIVTVSLVAIVGVAALAVDAGWLLHHRRKAQAVADGAALAAATSLFENYRTLHGYDDGSAEAAALAIVSAANSDPADPVLTGTVHIPPLSGPFTGQAGYAEVIVNLAQPRLFSALWGATDLAVASRAVAVGKWEPAKIGIHVLDPTAPSALAVRGNGGINVSGGASIIVNSNNSARAAEIGASGDVYADNVYVTGGVLTGSSGQFYGDVHTGQTPSPDPLRNLSPPDMSTLTLRSSKRLETGAGTLQPGIYRGGIKFSSDRDLTLNPGIYYLDGGGLTIGGNGSIHAHGVMIYNAPGGLIDVSSNGTLDITPMTSGDYEGIVLFQDRNSTSQVKVSANGCLDSQLSGTVYAANAAVIVSANGDFTAGQFICRTLDVSGNGSLLVNYSGGAAKTRILHLTE